MSRIEVHRRSGCWAIRIDGRVIGYANRVLIREARPILHGSAVSGTFEAASGLDLRPEYGSRYRYLTGAWGRDDVRYVRWAEEHGQPLVEGETAPMAFCPLVPRKTTPTILGFDPCEMPEQWSPRIVPLRRAR